MVLVNSIMSSWRRKRQGEIHDQEDYMIRSENRRPYQEIWQSNVPSWEKQFCSSVGLISWRKFLEMKSYVYLYDNVVKWNDSAGEEAFNNAKNRFWAKIKGLPCDLSPPDPDIYIDSIDWNSTVDPELFLDLEREPKPSVDNNEDGNVVTLTEALLQNQSFSCTGWGDAEEDFQKGNESQNPRIDPWECRNEAIGDKGWGYNPNEWGKSFNQLGSNYDELRRVDRYHWPKTGTNGLTENVTGWYDSRYKTSRFPNNEYQIDRGYRGRRKRVNFAQEKHDLRQWTIKS